MIRDVLEVVPDTTGESVVLLPIKVIVKDGEVVSATPTRHYTVAPSGNGVHLSVIAKPLG